MLKKGPRFLFFLLVFLWFPVSFAARFRIIGQDSPPYFYKETPDSTKILGAAVDVNQAVCEKLKLDCFFEVVTVARMFIELQNGDADMATTVSKNPETTAEREKFMTMSDPIFYQNNTFNAVKNEAQPFKNPNELDGWSIASIRGSNSENRIKLLIQSGVKISLFSEAQVSIILQKLAQHRYGPPEKSAVIYAEPMLLHYAKKLGIELETLYTYPQKQIFLNGFSKKVDSNIVNAFNKALAEMKVSQELGKIARQYNVTPAD